VRASLPPACMLLYRIQVAHETFLQWQKIAFQVVFCFVLEVTTYIGGACIFIIAGSTPIWFFFPLSTSIGALPFKKSISFGTFFKNWIMSFSSFKIWFIENWFLYFFLFFFLLDYLDYCFYNFIICEFFSIKFYHYSFYC